MSPVVFPSPLPIASPGSLLVTGTRTTIAAGSHTSLTSQAAHRCGSGALSFPESDRPGSRIGL